MSNNYNSYILTLIDITSIKVYVHKQKVMNKNCLSYLHTKIKAYEGQTVYCGWQCPSYGHLWSQVIFIFLCIHGVNIHK